LNLVCWIPQNQWHNSSKEFKAGVFQSMICQDKLGEGLLWNERPAIGVLESRYMPLEEGASTPLCRTANRSALLWVQSKNRWAAFFKESCQSECFKRGVTVQAGWMSVQINPLVFSLSKAEFLAFPLDEVHVSLFPLLWRCVASVRILDEAQIVRCII